MAAPGHARHDSADRDRERTARLRTTRAGRILFADGAAGRLLRRDPSGLRDQPFAVFVPMRERRTFRSRLALLPAGGRVHDWHLALTTASGTEIDVLASVEARVGAATDGGGELHWTLVAAAPSANGAGRDVEPVDARAASERGDEAERARLAHELRQPLSAIISYAQGAILRSRNGSLTPADLEGVLEIIVTEALRVAERLRGRQDDSGGE